MIRLLLALIFTVLLAPANAQTLKILSAGAMKHAVLELVPAFESKHGVKVEVLNDTAGALLKRINAGESFDITLLTAAGLDTLSANGKIDPASARVLARIGIGVAVKAGAPHPPLQTEEQFRAALHSANRIALIDPAAGGSSGIYLDALFQRWGIRESIRAKAVFLPGGLTAEKIVSGEADLAIQQSSELLVVPGAEMVGLLPDAIQNYTAYGYGISSSSRMRAAADAFVAALSSNEASGMMRARSMLPVQ